MDVGFDREQKVVATEDDERDAVLAGEPGVAPPPTEEAVVAEELLEVLVDAPGSVVFDEEEGGAVPLAALDLEHCVGRTIRRRASRSPSTLRASSRRSSARRSSGGGSNSLSPSHHIKVDPSIRCHARAQELRCTS
jgi:hypothetical protein